MRRYVIASSVLLVLLLLGLLLLFIPARATELASDSGVRVSQVDTSRYPEVTLYVNVEDANGQAQPNLRQGDFVITEDGTPVEVTSFAGAGATAVSTLLLMDCSGSMDDDGKLEGAQEAAERYISLMRPGDRTAVVSFCDRPQVVQPFTDNQERLERAINRLDADGSTPLYDGLVKAIDLLSFESGRRALILLSDGQDCLKLPCDENPGSSTTLNQMIARAQGASLDVQVIGLGDPGDEMFDEVVLQRIAEQTGGSYFHAPSAEDLATLYAQLGGSLHEEYALTYTSPRPFYDGTRRDIAVVVDGRSSTGGYVEEHLINVRSNGLVGILLLLPLLGALAAPSMLRRRRLLVPLPAADGAPAAGSLAPALATTGATIFQPSNLPSTQAAIGATVVQPPQGTRQCVSCGTTLRDRSRFCNRCGTEQPIAAVTSTQRAFCDQCGRPLLSGARFCMMCGSTSPVSSRSEHE